MLNDLSHSAEVTGNVQRMRSRTFMLGKKIGSHSLSVAEALFGRLDLSATFDHYFDTNGQAQHQRHTVIPNHLHKTELLHQLWHYFN